MLHYISLDKIPFHHPPSHSQGKAHHCGIFWTKKKEFKTIIVIDRAICFVFEKNSLRLLLLRHLCSTTYKKYTPLRVRIELFYHFQKKKKNERNSQPHLHSVHIMILLLCRIFFTYIELILICVVFCRRQGRTKKTFRL